MLPSVYTIEVQSEYLLLHPDSNSDEAIQVEITEKPSAYPVLKWAGGKQWLAVAAKHLLPPNWRGRYYETFLGGGAFFFAVQPSQATISDLNQELITTYQAIREEPERVIQLLRTYPHDEEFYYTLRAKEPRKPHTIAARFLYLNHTCWNGLYRVNAEGRFNTPFGRYDNPTICDEERINSASEALQHAQIEDGSFQNIVLTVQPGDFAYFDPPFITGHQNNGFLKYNKTLFSWADQENLARHAIQLANAGVYVLVSNADYPAVINLYKGFYCYRAKRRSLIGGQANSRGIITEALLSNYPLLGYETEVVQ
ncbi:MAG TPA: Dam family site-specific DNA-(adenine-N6)-methyltransferase [Pyrinomonadaceae bacterium]|jgi:DNA adenine methylase